MSVVCAQTKLGPVTGYIVTILRRNLFYVIYYKKFWAELIAYFPFIWHGRHRKRHVQKLFYFCVCIRCSGNVFTEPLPTNDREIHIRDRHRLMGGIYEVRRWDGLKCHDIHTEFRKDKFRHSKVDRRGFTDTHSMIISLAYFYFFKIRKVG
jgi:predicted phosphatase